MGECRSVCGSVWVCVGVCGSVCGSAWETPMHSHWECVVVYAMLAV